MEAPNISLDLTRATPSPRNSMQDDFETAAQKGYTLMLCLRYYFFVAFV